MVVEIFQFFIVFFVGLEIDEVDFSQSETTLITEKKSKAFQTLSLEKNVTLDSGCLWSSQTS